MWNWTYISLYHKFRKLNWSQGQQISSGRWFFIYKGWWTKENFAADRNNTISVVQSTCPGTYSWLECDPMQSLSSSCEIWKRLFTQAYTNLNKFCKIRNNTYYNFFFIVMCNVKIIKNKIIVKVGNKLCQTWRFQLPKISFCIVSTVLLLIMNVCTLIP